MTLREPLTWEVLRGGLTGKSLEEREESGREEGRQGGREEGRKRGGEVTQRSSPVTERDLAEVTQVIRRSYAFQRLFDLLSAADLTQQVLRGRSYAELLRRALTQQVLRRGLTARLTQRFCRFFLIPMSYVKSYVLTLRGSTYL